MSILKEISPAYSLEGLMLKLKLQYLGYLMQWANSLRPWYWERLRAREGDDRGWHGSMASLTQWAWVWANSRRSWRTREPGVLQFMGSQRIRHDLETQWQQQSTRLARKTPPRKGYWSGLPFPSQGDPLNPGIKPLFPALPGRIFTSEPLG